LAYKIADQTLITATFSHPCFRRTRSEEEGSQQEIQVTHPSSSNSITHSTQIRREDQLQFLIIDGIAI